MNMKMRSNLLLLSLLVSAGAFAQKGIEDGSRYGHGQDSIKCIENISIYTEHVKTNDFAEAYPFWKEVFNDAPLAQAATYTNGAKILRDLITKETDADKKAAYTDELLQVYEQRLKYLDELNRVYNTNVTVAEVKGLQAHDYITYNSKVNIDKAYSYLREAVTLGAENTTYYVLGDLMKISNAKYKKDKDAHREGILQDYLDCSTYINAVIAKQTSDQLLAAARNTKDNIDAYFVNSGAADCESLQAIYAPKVEENKGDLEYLTKVVKVMDMLKCTNSDAYFAAAEYAYKISPSSETAKSLGLMYANKRQEYEKAMEYLDQAIELESDDAKKASLYYAAGAIMFGSMKQAAKAKPYIQKAISLNPNDGNSYILLAQMYASNIRWCDDAPLNQCTYFVVLDKLQRAKSVDPSVADKANELIRTYSAHTPKAEDLFMYRYKKGDTIEIKGWINETTTIR